MIKNLTFWSVILGFIFGTAVNSGTWFINAMSSNITAINYKNVDYWKFAFVSVIAIVFGVIFYFAEKTQNDKAELKEKKRDDALSELIQELRLERQEQKLFNQMLLNEIKELRQDVKNGACKYVEPKSNTDKPKQS